MLFFNHPKALHYPSYNQTNKEYKKAAKIIISVLEGRESEIKQQYRITEEISPQNNLLKTKEEIEKLNEYTEMLERNNLQGLKIKEGSSTESFSPIEGIAKLRDKRAGLTPVVQKRLEEYNTLMRITIV